ncbi:hypothetical protein GCM10009825_39240 [Arthrobacter humicola]|uniref:Uncharacterized protein n=1 Tax=Arthrobacter humicola TaxID=409291 RepID=A0ABP5LGN7_9MICC
MPADPDHPPGPGPTGHPDQDPIQDPGQDPIQDPIQDPGQDPEPELPPDPFPDWHHFTAGHPFPAANTDDPGWPEPLDDPIPEELVLSFL